MNSFYHEPTVGSGGPALLNIQQGTEEEEEGDSEDDGDDDERSNDPKVDK